MARRFAPQLAQEGFYSLSAVLSSGRASGGVAWQQNPRSRLAAGLGDPGKLFKKSYDVGGDVRTETGDCNTREQNHPNRPTAQKGGGSLQQLRLGVSGFSESGFIF